MTQTDQSDPATRRIERIKEELHLVRMAAGILLVAQLSVLAWFGQHMKTLDARSFVIWVVAFAALSTSLSALGRHALALLDKMEKP